MLKGKNGDVVFSDPLEEEEARQFCRIAGFLGTRVWMVRSYFLFLVYLLS